MWRAYKTMKKMLFLVLCVLMMGELAEIEYQSVAAGEYIKQYAIVQKINPAGSYVSGLCTDCSCTLTIRDSFNAAIIQNQPMTQLDTGLFGYVNSPGLLEENANYLTFANCSSTLYGWGIAFGQLEQSKTASISVTGDSSNFTVTSGKCEILNIGCHLNNIYGSLLTLSNSIKEIPASISDAISKVLGNTTDSTAWKLLKGFGGLLLIFGTSMLKMMFNPVQWIKEDLIPLLILGIQTVILWLFIPLALIEAFIIGHSLLVIAGLQGRNRFFVFITTYINDHLNIVRTVVGFIWNIHVAAFDILIKLISIVKP